MEWDRYMLVSIRARIGQRIWMFLRAVSLLSQLNTFKVSTISIASAPSSSNRFLIAWIPASHAASCPAYSCLLPTAFRISSCVTLRMALEIRRLSVSPTPIGLTPGHLSRAMRRQVVRAEICSTSFRCSRRSLFIASMKAGRSCFLCFTRSLRMSFLDSTSFVEYGCGGEPRPQHLVHSQQTRSEMLGGY